MENNQSLSMDRNFFRESLWNDVKGYGSVQDFGNYPASASGWGSGPSSPSVASQATGHVDKELYKNLLEMIPIVDSFMESRANKSYAHQGTLVFTPKPPRDLSSSQKMLERRGGKTPSTRSGKKQRTPKVGEVDNCKNNSMENEDYLIDEVQPDSTRSSAPDRENLSTGNKYEPLISENNMDLLRLQSQIEELQKKLAEKEELLKSTESSAIQIEMMQVKLEELQQQNQEKDSLIKSAHLQLCHKKNELADVKSLLKKAEEDSQASNQKAQKLQDDLNGLQRQIAAFISFFEILKEKSPINKTEEVQSSEAPDVDPSILTHDSQLNGHHKEGVEDEEFMAFSEADKTEMEAMEQARKGYLKAVIAAKNDPCEDTLSVAADLRLQLQQLLLKPSLENILNDNL
ncbi:hypothetical protein SUGI_0322510 [Cryptomeria japonica]|uniref:protein MICROTUBULE BINDING PROTEIN 2C n=1 Tax=Cryptomeria japonica TaxID=3369 RepID=UPI002408EA6E|nr:protein MICROTUBULE BINDING PROTEIN 2C [Cryptomeria japonica]GLJ18235.1 hypothetical protein SUGI_0322510 [Cryptomeria japonica]